MVVYEDTRARHAKLILAMFCMGAITSFLSTAVLFWGVYILLHQGNPLTESFVLFIISLCGLSFFLAFLIACTDSINLVRILYIINGRIKARTFGGKALDLLLSDIGPIQKMPLKYPRSTLSIFERSSDKNYKVRVGRDHFYLSAHVQGVENLIKELSSQRT